MWMDKRAEFCDDIAVSTGGSATVAIGEVIDTGDARDHGVFGPHLVIQVSEAFTGGTSCQFVLASDAQDPLSADGNETRHYASDVFTVGQLTLGFTLSIPLPTGDTAQGEDSVGYERYLGIETVLVGVMTAGKIRAFLSPDPYSSNVYPEGNN